MKAPSARSLWFLSSSVNLGARVLLVVPPVGSGWIQRPGPGWETQVLSRRWIRACLKLPLGTGSGPEAQGKHEQGLLGGLLGPAPGTPCSLEVEARLGQRRAPLQKVQAKIPPHLVHPPTRPSGASVRSSVPFPFPSRRAHSAHL